MPAWIHNRAKHLLAKNPDMSKSTAFAVATQQAHATGKTPKGFGTSQGKREAKAKYDKPKKEYKKTSNPGGLDTPKLACAAQVSLEALVKEGMSFRPGAWRAQAGFTPAGMKTPAQRLQKTMGVGKFDNSKDLKPLNIKVSSIFGVALDKVAESEDRSKKKMSPAARLALGGYAGANLGAVGSQIASASMEKGVEKEKAITGAEDLFNRVAKRSPVPVVTEVANVPNAAFNPGSSLLKKLNKLPSGGIKEILELTPQAALMREVENRGVSTAKPHLVVGEGFKSPSVLAHETGHAQLDKSRLGRLLQNRATMLGARLSTPAALAAGAMGGSSDDKRRQQLAALGVGAVTLPELGYEAGASLKGMKTLRQAGASPEQLRAARRALLPAFGTYGGKALATLGAASLGAGVGRALKNRKERKASKTASINERRLETLPMTRQRSADVPNSAFKVKAGGEEGDCGCSPKAKTKVSFQVSQYSGPLNPERMKYHSYLPPFSAPPIKTAGPPSSGKAKKASPITAMLSRAKKVGAPKATPPKGPSIAQISKPIGYGKPLAGTTKT